jgi:hypothetical protein
MLPPAVVLLPVLLLLVLRSEAQCPWQQQGVKLVS